MPDLNFPQRTILLDGGMGRELRFRGREDLDPEIYAVHARDWLKAPGPLLSGGVAGHGRPILPD